MSGCMAIQALRLWSLGTWARVMARSVKLSCRTPAGTLQVGQTMIIDAHGKSIALTFCFVQGRPNYVHTLEVYYGHGSGSQ